MTKKKRTPLEKLAGKRAVTATLRLVMDADLIDAQTRAAAVRDAAERKQRLFANTDPGNPDRVAAEDAYRTADAEFQRISDEVEEATVDFRFRALSRQRYQDLVRAHPPTQEQKDNYAKEAAAQGLPKAQQSGLRFNTDTFPAALVAACLIEPAVDADTVQEWWDSDDWNETELTRLLITAETACRSVAELPR